MELFQLLLSGLASGCVYGLIALGFVLIYKATEAVTLQHTLSIALSPLLTFLLALVPLKLSQIRCCEVLDFASLLEYYVNIMSRGYDCSVDPFITSVFSEDVKQYRWQQRWEQLVGANIWSPRELFPG